MPRKQAKSSRTSKTASTLDQPQHNHMILSQPPNEWDQGFMVHKPGLLNGGDLVLGCLSISQWKAASELIERGYTLGFVAGITEAPAIAAECAQRFKAGIVVKYVEDDLMLYMAKNDRCLSPVVEG